LKVGVLQNVARCHADVNPHVNMPIQGRQEYYVIRLLAC